MEKYIYNEKNGLWYELQGDYYLPCLKLPKEETAHIGIFGQRHRRYLKTHRKALYTSLLASGKLNSYLADIDRLAEGMFSRLVKQLTEKEGVTETLKAENQMLWVQKMNNLKNAASRGGSVPVISYEDCTGRFHRVQISASLPQPTPG